MQQCDHNSLPRYIFTCSNSSCGTKKWLEHQDPLPHLHTLVRPLLPSLPLFEPRHRPGPYHRVIPVRRTRLAIPLVAEKARTIRVALTLPQSPIHSTIILNLLVRLKWLFSGNRLIMHVFLLVRTVLLFWGHVDRFRLSRCRRHAAVEANLRFTAEHYSYMPNLLKSACRHLQPLYLVQQTIRRCF